MRDDMHQKVETQWKPAKFYKIKQTKCYVTQGKWGMTCQLRNIIQVTWTPGAMFKELERSCCLKLLIALMVRCNDKRHFRKTKQSPGLRKGKSERKKPTTTKIPKLHPIYFWRKSIVRIFGFIWVGITVNKRAQR